MVFFRRRWLALWWKNFLFLSLAGSQMDRKRCCQKTSSWGSSSLSSLLNSFILSKLSPYPTNSAPLTPLALSLFGLEYSWMRFCSMLPSPSDTFWFFRRGRTWDYQEVRFASKKTVSNPHTRGGLPTSLQNDACFFCGDGALGWVQYSTQWGHGLNRQLSHELPSSKGRARAIPPKHKLYQAVVPQKHPRVYHSSSVLVPLKTQIH